MNDALPAILISRLLDDTADAVIIIDDRCRIRYLNTAMQTLTGYSAGELLGESLNGLLPDTLAAHHDAHVMHYIGSTAPSSVLGQVREFAIRHRSAVMIPIEMKALDLGTVDGVRYFGAFMQDIRARRAMKEKNANLLAQLERQALSDVLTGLPNRRAFAAEATQAMARAARNGAALTVGVADVDHFKKINDRYGHLAGDTVLCAVAQALRDSGRVTDLAARLGGEEFGLLLPDASLEQAAGIAERMRAAIATLHPAAPDGSLIKVTISIGLARLGADGTLDAALSEADKALYRAKRQGRDRVELALDETH